MPSLIVFTVTSTCIICPVHCIMKNLKPIFQGDFIFLIMGKFLKQILREIFSGSSTRLIGLCRYLLHAPTWRTGVMEQHSNTSVLIMGSTGHPVLHWMLEYCTGIVQPVLALRSLRKTWVHN